MIVARDRRDLYETLCREFADDSKVAVVLDRRLGERRRQVRDVAHDHRRADRRQADADDNLRRLGWAAVRAR